MNRYSKATDPLEPGCPEICPGCDHKWISYDESLLLKERWLKKKLSSWADYFDPIQKVKPEMRWNYRGKVCLSARWDSNGWKMGLVSYKEIIPIHECPVHIDTVRQSVSLFSQNLPSGSDFPMVYYIQSQAQVVLVLKSRTLPDLSWLDTHLKNHLNRIGIEGLWVHLHPSAGRKVFSKNTWHLIHGLPRSVGKDGLIYGPKSFQQLIPSLYGQVLNKAKNFLNPGPNDCMIDLYCGIGTGLSRWTDKGCRPLGVELDGEAADCARINEPKATVLRGKCKDRIPQLSEWVNTPAYENGQHLLYVNPPRTGLEPEISDWITKIYKPDRIAYLSCSAGTLKRDLDRFKSPGYTMINITPYDFFPQTHHVETLAFLQACR